MKIKLLILEKDANYMKKLVAAFNLKFEDRFEIYCFTDEVAALDASQDIKIDVVIASSAFDIDTKALPKNCGFAYLVDSPDIETVKDEVAISKFQKIDQIYKQILSLYAENAGKVSSVKVGDNAGCIIAFSSPVGGAGSSSMAAACALHFSTLGKKVLYLNFEKFGSSDLFFEAEGQFGMSDIVYALKSKKTNLSVKLESCIKQDASGVYFYSQPKLALDIMELTEEEKIRLVKEHQQINRFDYIILDLDFTLDLAGNTLCSICDSIVLVSNGSDIANSKITRTLQAIKMIEGNKEVSVTERLCLAYNKFSNKTSLVIDGVDIKDLGGMPRYEHATTKQIITELSHSGLFDKIISW